MAAARRGMVRTLRVRAAGRARGPGCERTGMNHCVVPLPPLYFTDTGMNHVNTSTIHGLLLACSIERDRDRER